MQARPRGCPLVVDSELAQIQAESIGWISLDEGTYLHVGYDATVIEVVGLAKADMQGSTYFGCFKLHLVH